MDVRLVEPETARPEEPKQVTIKKNVLLVVVTGATALVIAFMFFGGSSKPETATINEPIVVASTMPEFLANESRNEDSFSLLERFQYQKGAIKTSRVCAYFFTILKCFNTKKVRLKPYSA